MYAWQEKFLARIDIIIAWWLAVLALTALLAA